MSAHKVGPEQAAARRALFSLQHRQDACLCQRVPAKHCRAAPIKKTQHLLASLLATSFRSVHLEVASSLTVTSVIHGCHFGMSSKLLHTFQMSCDPGACPQE